MTNAESDDHEAERLYNSRSSARINDYRLGYRQGIRAVAEMAATLSENRNLETLLLQKFNLRD